MACRSCRRSLLAQLSARQGFLSSNETRVAPIAAQFTRQAGAITQCPQQQRRDFRSTARNQKSWIPKPIRDAASSVFLSAAQPYQVHASTEVMYRTSASAAAYTISETDKRNGTVKKTEEGEEIGTGNTTWHTDFNLPPTFSTWSQVTMLHLYLLYARMRNLPRDAAKSWHKQLTDHFFFDAEERMDVVHGISSRGLRHRYLKDLFIQWRGVIAAYDEGVTKGDAVLAAAVWRNVYKARGDVDVRNLAAITSWIRACLKSLDQMPDEALFYGTASVFKLPAKNEFSLVDKPSRELEGILLDRPSVVQAQKRDVPIKEQPKVVTHAVA